MYKKIKRTKLISGKKYRYVQGFSSKRDAQRYAKALKEGGYADSVRVLKGKTMYVHGKGKGHTMYRVYGR